MPSPLIAAYLATTYAYTGPDGVEVRLRVGEANTSLGALMAARAVAGAAFITAFNPRSRPAAPAVNEAAQARLRAALETAGAEVFEGEGRGDGGGDGADWPPEPSFLALGLSFAEAGRLAVAFEQTAILYMGADAVPRLCLGYAGGV